MKLKEMVSKNQMQLWYRLPLWATIVKMKYINDNVVKWRG